MIPKRTRLDPKKDIRRVGRYDDQKTPSEAEFETNPVVLADNLDNIASAIKRILKGEQAGNWFDRISAAGVDRGLDDIVNKRVLTRLGFSTSTHVVNGAYYSTAADTPLLPNKSLAIDGVNGDDVGYYLSGTYDAGTLANNFVTDDDGNIINNVTIVSAATGEPIETASGYPVHGALVYDATDGLPKDASKCRIVFYYVDPATGTKTATTISDTCRFSLPYQQSLITISKAAFLQPGGAAGMEVKDMFSSNIKVRAVAAEAITIGDPLMLDGSGELAKFDETTSSNRWLFAGVAEASVSAGGSAAGILLGLVQFSPTTITGYTAPANNVFIYTGGTLGRYGPGTGLQLCIGYALSASSMIVIPPPINVAGYMFSGTYIATSPIQMGSSDQLDMNGGEIANASGVTTGTLTVSDSAAELEAGANLGGDVDMDNNDILNVGDIQTNQLSIPNGGGTPITAINNSDTTLSSATPSETLVTENVVKSFALGAVNNVPQWLEVSAAGAYNGRYSLNTFDANRRPVYKNRESVTETFGDASLDAELPSLLSVWTMDDSSGNLVDVKSLRNLVQTYEGASAPVYGVTSPVKHTACFRPNISTYEVDLSMDIDSHSFNLNFWLYAPGASAYVLALMNASTNDGLRFYWLSATSRLYLQVLNNGGVASQDYVSFGGGSFRNVNLRYDFATDRAYFKVNNGTEKLFGPLASQLCTMANLKLVIEPEASAGNNMSGYLDELVLFSDLISSDAQTALYNGGTGNFYTPGVEPTAVVYDTDRWKLIEDYEGVGETVIDAEAAASTYSDPLAASPLNGGSAFATDDITVLDEDSMDSDSATAVPTQQSVKTFVQQQPNRIITDTDDDIELTDSIIFLEAATATVTATLPAAATADKRTFRVKALDITYTCKVAAAALDGGTEVEFTTQYQSYDFYSDGTSWYMF